MIYLLIILFAYWNAYVIRWKLNRFGTSERDSRIWHRIGVPIRIGVLLIALYPFMGSWYTYVLNPACGLNSWHGGILTILLIFGMSYWLYNYIINRINKWDWDYNGFKDRKHYRVLLYVWAAITLAWGIGGGYFVKWVL